MSIHPSEPPRDAKKNAIVPITEYGRDYPEGEPEINPIKYYKVICPRCRAQPGFLCFADQKKKTVSYYQVCIARTILYDAFELGSVDVNGIGRNGKVILGKE